MKKNSVLSITLALSLIVTTGVANNKHDPTIWAQTQKQIKDTTWSHSASKCIWACNNHGKTDEDGNDANKILRNLTKTDPYECANYNLGSKQYETSDKQYYAQSSAGDLCGGECKSLVDKPMSVIFTIPPKRYYLNEDNVCGNDWMPRFVHSQQGKISYEQCKAYLKNKFSIDNVTYTLEDHEGQPYAVYKHPDGKTLAYDCNTDGWIDVSEYYE